MPVIEANPTTQPTSQTSEPQITSTSALQVPPADIAGYQQEFSPANDWQHVKSPVDPLGNNLEVSGETFTVSGHDRRTGADYSVDVSLEPGLTRADIRRDYGLALENGDGGFPVIRIGSGFEAWRNSFSIYNTTDRMAISINPDNNNLELMVYNRPLPDGTVETSKLIVKPGGMAFQHLNSQQLSELQDNRVAERVQQEIPAANRLQQDIPGARLVRERFQFDINVQDLEGFRSLGGRFEACPRTGRPGLTFNPDMATVRVAGQEYPGDMTFRIDDKTAKVELKETNDGYQMIVTDTPIGNRPGEVTTLDIIPREYTIENPDYEARSINVRKRDGELWRLLNEATQLGWSVLSTGSAKGTDIFSIRDAHGQEVAGFTRSQLEDANDVIARHLHSALANHALEQQRHAR